jgi:spoIIIJ-associated protein
MEWVETTGKTIAEAKDLALDQLGVDEADAEFQVVNDAKVGLFGRVRAEARVRARVRPAQPRPKDGGNSGRRRKGRPERGERSASADGESRGSKSKASKSQDLDDAPDSESETTSTSNDDTDDDEGGAQERPARSRSSSRRSRSKKTRTAERTAPEEGVPTVDEEVALARQGEIAKEFLEGLFTETSATAAVAFSVDEEEELVHVAVDGDNLGHLIGPRGVTLQSLQELTRTAVQRKTGARNGRIIVDIAQYREKRRVALERFTQDVAQQVIDAGDAKTLEPMNPADRKVVHDTVNGIDGVVTTSEGEEPRRYVVIRPA